MKVLYVLRSTAELYYQGGIIRQLCLDGHTVHALFDRTKDADNSSQGVLRLQEEVRGFSFGKSLKRSDLWRKPLFHTRELLNYARYLKPEGQSPYYLQRWERYLSGWVQAGIRLKAVKRLLAQPSVQRSLWVAAQWVPPDHQISRALKKERPDVVVASAVNLRYSEEVEYIKAAKALSIPCVVPVLSWDNLTTKGVFHAIPDLTLVWNRKQLDEVVNFHRIPSDRVVITGAPMFDRWFDIAQPSVDRTTFCRQVGLDPTQPFVVYLGSSANIAADETWIVKELAECLRASPNSEVREIGILVRPHPANVTIWKQSWPEKIRVWPQERGLPHTPEAMQCFYDTLCFAMCTTGLNTSGMIDALVADKPCVAIMTSRYESTQARALHFQTLLQADALETVSGPAQCVERIAALLHGDDYNRAKRRQFVNEFIRPAGYHKAAGQLSARAIELAAMRFTSEQINSALCSD